MKWAAVLFVVAVAIDGLPALNLPLDPQSDSGDKKTNSATDLGVGVSKEDGVTQSKTSSHEELSSESNQEGSKGRTVSQSVLNGIQPRSSQVYHGGPINHHAPHSHLPELHPYNQNRNYASENDLYRSQNEHQSGSNRRFGNFGSHNGGHRNGFWNYNLDNEQLLRGAGHNRNNEFVRGTGIQQANSAEYNQNHGHIKENEDLSEVLNKRIKSHYLRGAGNQESAFTNSVPQRPKYQETNKNLNQRVNVVDTANDNKNQVTAEDNSEIVADETGYVDESYRRDLIKGQNTDKISETDDKEENSGQYSSKYQGPVETGDLGEVLNRVLNKAHVIRETGNQGHSGKHHKGHGNTYQGNANGDLGEVLNKGLNQPHFGNHRINPGKYLNGILTPTDAINYGTGNGYRPILNEYLNGVFNHGHGRTIYPGPVNPGAVPVRYINGGFAQEGSAEQYNEEDSHEANEKYVSEILNKAQRILNHEDVPNSHGPTHHHPSPQRRPVFGPVNHGVRFYNAATGSYLANPGPAPNDDESYERVASGYVAPTVFAPEFYANPSEQYYGQDYYRNGGFDGQGPSYIPGADRSGPTTIFGRNPVFNNVGPDLPISAIPLSNIAGIDENTVIIDNTLAPSNPFKPSPLLPPLTPVTTVDTEYEGTNEDASDIIIDRDLIKNTYDSANNLKKDGTTKTGTVKKDLSSKMTHATNVETDNDEISKNNKGFSKTVPAKHNRQHGKDKTKIDEDKTKIIENKGKSDINGKENDKTNKPGKLIVKTTVAKPTDEDSNEETLKRVKRILEKDVEAHIVTKNDGKITKPVKSIGNTGVVKTDSRDNEDIAENSKSLRNKNVSGIEDESNNKDNDEANKQGESIGPGQTSGIRNANGKDRKDNHQKRRIRRVKKLKRHSRKNLKSNDMNKESEEAVKLDVTQNTEKNSQDKDIKDKTVGSVENKVDDDTNKNVQSIVTEDSDENLSNNVKRYISADKIDSEDVVSTITDEGNVKNNKTDNIDQKIKKNSDTNDDSDSKDSEKSTKNTKSGSKNTETPEIDNDQQNKSAEKPEEISEIDDITKKYDDDKQNLSDKSGEGVTSDSLGNKKHKRVEGSGNQDVPRKTRKRSKPKRRHDKGKKDIETEKDDVSGKFGKSLSDDGKQSFESENVDNNDSTKTSSKEDKAPTYGDEQVFESINNDASGKTDTGEKSPTSYDDEDSNGTPKKSNKRHKSKRNHGNDKNVVESDSDDITRNSDNSGKSSGDDDTHVIEAENYGNSGKPGKNTSEENDGRDEPVVRSDKNDSKDSNEKPSTDEESSRDGDKKVVGSQNDHSQDSNKQSSKPSKRGKSKRNRGKDKQVIKTETNDASKKSVKDEISSSNDDNREIESNIDNAPGTSNEGNRSPDDADKEVGSKNDDNTSSNKKSRKPNKRGKSKRKQRQGNKTVGSENDDASEKSEKRDQSPTNGDSQVVDTKNDNAPEKSDKVSTSPKDDGKEIVESETDSKNDSNDTASKGDLSPSDEVKEENDDYKNFSETSNKSNKRKKSKRKHNKVKTVVESDNDDKIGKTKSPSDDDDHVIGTENNGNNYSSKISGIDNQSPRNGDDQVLESKTDDASDSSGSDTSEKNYTNGDKIDNEDENNEKAFNKPSENDKFESEDVEDKSVGKSETGANKDTNNTPSKSSKHGKTKRNHQPRKFDKDGDSQINDNDQDVKFKKDDAPGSSGEGEQSTSDEGKKTVVSESDDGKNSNKTLSKDEKSPNGSDDRAIESKDDDVLERSGKSGKSKINDVNEESNKEASKSSKRVRSKRKHGKGKKVIRAANNDATQKSDKSDAPEKDGNDQTVTNAENDNLSSDKDSLSRSNDGKRNGEPDNENSPEKSDKDNQSSDNYGKVKNVAGSNDDLSDNSGKGVQSVDVRDETAAGSENDDVPSGKDSSKVEKNRKTTESSDDDEKPAINDDNTNENSSNTDKVLEQNDFGNNTTLKDENLTIGNQKPVVNTTGQNASNDSNQARSESGEDSRSESSNDEEDNLPGNSGKDVISSNPERIEGENNDDETDSKEIEQNDDTLDDDEVQEDGTEYDDSNNEKLDVLKGTNDDNTVVQSDDDASGNADKTNESEDTDDENLAKPGNDDAPGQSDGLSSTKNTADKKDEKNLEPKNDNNNDSNESIKGTSENSDKTAKLGRTRSRKGIKHTKISTIVGHENDHKSDTAVSENDVSSKNYNLSVTTEKPEPNRDEVNDTQENESTDSTNDGFSIDDKLKVTGERPKTGEDENNGTKNDESKPGDSSIIEHDDDQTSDKSDRSNQFGSKRGRKRRHHTKIGKSHKTDAANIADDKTLNNEKLIVTSEKPKTRQNEVSENDLHNSENGDSSITEYDKDQTSDISDRSDKPGRKHSHKRRNHNKIRKGHNNDHKTSNIKSADSENDDSLKDDKFIVTSEKPKTGEDENNDMKPDRAENEGQDNENATGQSAEEKNGEQKHKIITKIGTTVVHKNDHDENNGPSDDDTFSVTNERPEVDQDGKIETKKDEPRNEDKSTTKEDVEKISNNSHKDGKTGRKRRHKYRKIVKAVGLKGRKNHHGDDLDDDKTTNQDVINDQTDKGQNNYHETESSEKANNASEDTKSVVNDDKQDSDVTDQDLINEVEAKKKNEKVAESGNAEDSNNENRDSGDVTNQSGKNDNSEEKSDTKDRTNLGDGNIEKEDSEVHNDSEDATEKSVTARRIHNRKHKKSHKLHKIVGRKGVKNDHVTNLSTGDQNEIAEGDKSPETNKNLVSNKPDIDVDNDDKKNETKKNINRKQGSENGEDSSDNRSVSKQDTQVVGSDKGDNEQPGSKDANENDGASSPDNTTVNNEAPVSDENNDDKKGEAVNKIREVERSENDDSIRNRDRDDKSDESDKRTVVTEKILRKASYRRRTKVGNKDIQKKYIEFSNNHSSGPENRNNIAVENSKNDKLTDQNTKLQNKKDKHKIRTKIVKASQNKRLTNDENDSANHSNDETTEKNTLTTNSKLASFFKAVTENADKNKNTDKTSTKNDDVSSPDSDETKGDSQSTANEKQSKPEHSQEDVANNDNKGTFAKETREPTVSDDIAKSTNDNDSTTTTTTTTEKDTNSDSEKNFPDDEHHDAVLDKESKSESNNDSTNNNNEGKTTDNSVQEVTITDSENKETSDSKNTPYTSNAKSKIERRITDLATILNNLKKRKLAKITITITQHETILNIEEFNNNSAGSKTAEKTKGTDEENGNTEENSNGNPANDNVLRICGKKEYSNDNEKESSGNESIKTISSGNEAAESQSNAEAKSTSSNNDKEQSSNTESEYEAGTEVESLTKDGDKTTHQKTSQDNEPSEQREGSKYTENSSDSKQTNVQSGQNSAFKDDDKNSFDNNTEGDVQSKKSTRDSASAEENKNEASASREYKKKNSNRRAQRKSSYRRKSVNSRKSSFVEESSRTS